MFQSIAGILLIFTYAAFGQGAAPPEFEVASVKLAKPPVGRFQIGCTGGPGTSDAGLYTCTNVNMANLLARAFHLGSYQMVNPNYGDPVKYDIAAKVPAGTTKEQLSPMLQNLLTQRFKLTYHYEKKEMATYQLVVAKGGIRMKESPPDPPADAGENPSARPARCGGVSMGPESAKWTVCGLGTKQIAGLLSSQMDIPVTNATGLTGPYDFVLTWDPRNRDQAASGDNPLPTLDVAIQEQLGLKLEMKKGSVDVFVIDHIEKTPWRIEPSRIVMRRPGAPGKGCGIFPL